MALGLNVGFYKIICFKMRTIANREKVKGYIIIEKVTANIIYSLMIV